jgi:Spy/CpxP family protein refolding chaperone
MIKKILGGMLCVTFLLLPAAVPAGQDLPGGKWWRVPSIAESLGLNQDQIQALDQAFVNSRRNMFELKSNMERERFELDNLMEKNNLDEAATLRQLKSFQESRSRLAKEKFKFVIKVKKILGAKSFRKLKAIYEKRRGGKQKKK